MWSLQRVGARSRALRPDRLDSISIQRVRQCLRYHVPNILPSTASNDATNRLSVLGIMLALMVSVLAPTSQPVHADTDIRPIAHEFYMTRGIFSSPTDGDDWGPRWSMDFPEAETHFLVALSRLTRVDAYPYDNAIGLDDLELWNFPFLYW